MMTGDIPEPAKERLLHLMRLLEKNEAPALTSAKVEELTGWTSHTVRKDISCLMSYLGECDRAAAGSSNGYTSGTLIPAIRKALGLNRPRRFCVVGLGRLGSAYLNFQFSEPGEFELAAGFDTNVNRVEILKSPVPLYPAYKMGEVICRFGIEISLLCVPVESAQETAEKLAAAGIRGIVNFAPAALTLPAGVIVRNVYLVDELRALAIKMREDHAEDRVMEVNE
jgi:redox-sensing transcriptional repressor